MANALSELFQNIANAIRNQTGESDDIKMKPAEFPEKIAPAEENVPIALNLSSGNQTIPAPEGVLMRSVVIQKPDTLLPENIAQGVNIAGIIGALTVGGSGGGSDKNVVYKTGSIYEPTATMTIDHEVGFVPDMIGLFCLGESKATAVIQWSINFSNAIINACDGDAPGKTATMTNGVYKMGIGQVRGFESTAVPMAGVYSVTDTSFTVGGSLATLDVNCYYSWFAIGGLI